MVRGRSQRVINAHLLRNQAALCPHRGIQSAVDGQNLIKLISKVWKTAVY